MNIEVSEDVANFLEELAIDEATTKTEIVRRALSVERTRSFAHRVHIPSRGPRSRVSWNFGSMSTEGPHQPEIIKSDRVLRRSEVTDVDAIKTKWSIGIAVTALMIGTGALIAAVIYNRPELTSWATGLISAIAGSAITYGFNKTNS
jgi:hypothetical protein